MKKENIFGVFIATSFKLKTDSDKKKANKNGDIFDKYLWGNTGVKQILINLDHIKYGSDLELILFEFYLDPLDDQIRLRKPVGNYRKKEKAIGLVFNIFDDFFEMSHESRVDYLKKIIIERLEELKIRVKKNKLDLDIDILILDTKEALKAFK